MALQHQPQLATGQNAISRLLCHEHLSAPLGGVPRLPLISTLLAFLDAQASAALAQGLNQQLAAAHEAAAILLSQLLEDGITALRLPWSTFSSEDSLPLPVQPTEHARERDSVDLELAEVLGHATAGWPDGRGQ